MYNFGSSQVLFINKNYNFGTFWDSSKPLASLKKDNDINRRDPLNVAFKRGHVEYGEGAFVDEGEVDPRTLKQDVNNVVVFLVQSIVENRVTILILPHRRPIH